jgi:hypothetical protein
VVWNWFHAPTYRFFFNFYGLKFVWWLGYRIISKFLRVEICFVLLATALFDNIYGLNVIWCSRLPNHFKISRLWNWFIAPGYWINLQFLLLEVGIMLWLPYYFKFLRFEFGLMLLTIEFFEICIGWICFDGLATDLF